MEGSDINVISFVWALLLSTSWVISSKCALYHHIVVGYGRLGVNGDEGVEKKTHILVSPRTLSDILVLDCKPFKDLFYCCLEVSTIFT
jgi:hypothetical protein